MGQGPPCKHERAHGSEAKTMTDYPSPLVKQSKADWETVGLPRNVEGTEETPGHVNSGAHKLRDVTCSILRLVGDSNLRGLNSCDTQLFLPLTRRPKKIVSILNRGLGPFYLPHQPHMHAQ